MGILGRIEDWLEKKKASNKFRDRFKKMRKKLDLVGILCPKCGHHKAFTKNCAYKCTRCGWRWR